MWNGLDLVQTVVHANATLAGIIVGAQAITFDAASRNQLGAVSNGSILQLR